MLKPIRAAMTAALLTIATFAMAAEIRGDHPDTYVVQKGDTLWDIAGRFLEKPWLWPEIWQANPQVANPHLIYPGDVLSLAYLDRVTVAEAGPRDIVAISVGARDGVDNGTVFSSWQVGNSVVDRVENGWGRSEDTFGKADKVRLPDEVSGHLMVFRTFDKVSYAMVMDTIKPVQVGQELKHPDAPY